MSSTTTPLLGLYKATLNTQEPADISKYNANFDTLDNALTLTGSQTSTNKTFTSPHLTTPTVDSGGLTVTAGGITVTAGGLQVTAGNLGVGGAPLSSRGIYLPSGGTVVAGGGFSSGIEINATLQASANSDVLTGVRIDPTFSDNSKTSVIHIGLWLQTGSMQIDSGCQVGFGGNALSSRGIYIQSSYAITASGGVAYGIELGPTLNAAANSDELVALFIDPTYADNGKTSVTHYPLRVPSLPAFTAGAKYVVVDAAGHFLVSALGPAS